MDDINKYTLKLIKRKSYFISEIRLKLLNKYSEEQVNKKIKELISLDILNDKTLLYLKVANLINNKLYGKNYIINYFNNKNISYNLIKYTLDRFDEDIFLNNKKLIVSRLLEKNKTEEEIEKYLEYKGY